MAERARYGIDGGYAGILVFVLAETGLALAGWRAARRRKPAVGIVAGIAGIAVLGSAASYCYSTGPGKLSVWRELLDELHLRGDEQVLDVGCGRGAVLVSAALRLPAGRVTGADIWRLRDQTGNSRAMTERNAAAEGVSDRTDIVDADARDLPFPSESFDLVLSSLAFDNISDAEERAKALREAVRVLRPGGRLRIVDDRADPYADVIREAGCPDTVLRRLDWRTWYGLPGHHMTLVAATKRAA